MTPEQVRAAAEQAIEVAGGLTIDGNTNADDKFYTLARTALPQHARWVMELLDRCAAAEKTMVVSRGLAKREARMRSEYPAGTCNAEDAWRDFSRDEEQARRDFSAALAALRKPLAGEGEGT